MARAILVALLLLALPASSVARESLIVRDRTGHCRRKPATMRLTSHDLARDLRRYFSGKKTRIRNFRTVLTEGRIRFCTRLERQTVEMELADLGMRAHLRHERDWGDWVYIRGTWHLLQQLDRRIAMGTVPTVARQRMLEARGRLQRKLEVGRGR